MTKHYELDKKTSATPPDISGPGLMRLIHGRDIYQDLREDWYQELYKEWENAKIPTTIPMEPGAERSDYSNTSLQGWGWGSPAEYDAIYDLLTEVKPKLYIEVGVWKGRSLAITMGYAQEMGLDTVAIAVDTWLGGIEHRGSPDEPSQHDVRHSGEWCGMPLLYQYFLLNMVNWRVTEIVVPFPQEANLAAKWLLKHNIKADLIYIDASHEEDDVYVNLVNYHKILSDSGVIYGDDYQWPGVQAAVKQFAKENNLSVGCVFGHNGNPTQDCDIVRWRLDKIP